LFGVCELSRDYNAVLEAASFSQLNLIAWAEHFTLFRKSSLDFYFFLLLSWEFDTKMEVSRPPEEQTSLNVEEGVTGGVDKMWCNCNRAAALQR
jgi:hypothetical protein